jgi:nucleoside-diphosphate-sugar epimerase
VFPANPYAIAKDSLRRFLEELHKKYPFVLKWARLFYMYGKGQNPNSLLSQLESAISMNAVEFNMSGGEQVRDYLPVEQVAENIVKIALQQKVTGVINCSSGEPVMLKDFVKNYLDKNNKKIRLNLGYYPYTDYEPFRFWGDNTKLKSILNDE